MLRRGKPVMDTNLDTIRSIETYEGKENPFKLTIEERVQFSCTFDNIKNYPFGQQKCFLEMRMIETDFALNSLQIQFILQHVNNEGPTVVGQYVIKDWTIDNEVKHRQTERNMTRVTMVLRRNIKSIFLVTYLPTILMNMINQGFDLKV